MKRPGYGVTALEVGAGVALEVGAGVAGGTRVMWIHAIFHSGCFTQKTEITARSSLGARFLTITLMCRSAVPIAEFPKTRARTFERS